MYFVVFWDKTSGIVPASWVSLESRTFKWPKTKNPALQIIRADNPQDNWITYNYIRLSGPFETYDEARDFELDTLNLSTNDDEGFAAIKANKKLKTVDKEKRICNKPLRFCDTEDESTPVQKKTKSKKKLISSSSSSESEEKENSIPMPPTTYVSQKDQKSSTTFKSSTSSHHSRAENQVKSSHLTDKSINSFSNTDDNNRDNDSVGSSLASLLQDPDFCRKDSAQSPRLNNDSDSIDSSNVRPRAMPSIRSIKKSNIPIRIQMDHSRQSSIGQPSPIPIRPLAELQDDQMSLPGSSEIDTQSHSCCRKVLSELKSLKTMVSSIYLTVSDKKYVSNDNTVKEIIDFGLPIQTRSQLAVFESKIQNVKAATQYQENIKQLGGASFAKHVRNALVFTVSDMMAYKMSWTGAKNTIKVDGLKFIKLITDTILKKWSASDEEKIEKVMKSWFQHAGDRLK